MECAWDETDYAELEQAYACQGGALHTPPTNATADLGAVAGGVVGIELHKLLIGDYSHSLVGKQVMLDLRNHTHYVTSFRLNPRCRFDHQRWRIERLPQAPGRVSLRAAFALGAQDTERWPDCAIRLEGHRFVRRRFCQQCQQYADAGMTLGRRALPAQKRCPICGRRMTARGFDVFEWLQGRSLPRGQGRRSLASLGFQAGDVFTVRGPAGDRHFALPVASRYKRPPSRDETFGASSV